MTRGRGTASIVASPVLVGAVTTLIVIVSVFLAYNANTGLPFVPTYNLKAELPSGANLVPGNEVRIGGFRVGIIDKLDTTTKTGVVNGKKTVQSIAVVRMKIDKVAEPLSVDTGVLVRPRSALGLKFIELTPGKSKRVFRDGDTIPLSQRTPKPVEFDDFLNTFDDPTRQNSQDALTGFGEALAGRGSDINDAIQGLAPFFHYLAPVMANLSDPSTRLDEFFKQIGRTSAQVAPVARVQAELFSNMADTFAAIGRSPSALRATIEKSPITEDVSIHSFRVQRPFLADFADLSRRLLPAAQALPIALPLLNSAFTVGTPVVRHSVVLNDETRHVFQALDDLVQNPNTLLGLKDLHALVRSAAPLFQYISPRQTVCNYATYFFNGLGSHISEGTSTGTAERVLLKSGGHFQEDVAYNNFGSRPSDLPPNVDPTGVKVGPPGAEEPAYVLHGQPDPPSIDAQGNADCVIGQFGYPDGPLLDDPSRYPAVNGSKDGSGPDQGTYNSWARAHGGGGHPVVADNPPFLYGPNFTSVPNLADVDKQLRAHGINP
ncbi:MAG: phospholipid/cholesterol/gamma-HCH transport system substrate-binding protein [Thermoleophilaceae bacterium]|nr:phospholipid/cholesterol/gamma-HCH transport system substrate-binding protein [Thermoleophilaceae bacterium]